LEASGRGWNIDITAELYLPAACHLEHLDRLNTVWWIAALLRLKATTLLYVPVISSEGFRSIPAIEQEPELYPMEIFTHRILPEDELNPQLGTSELEWLKSHWQDSSDLLAEEQFSNAIQAVDLSIWGRSPSLALVAVWGALERLFSTSKQELSFRVSSNIAAYLEPPGRERYKCFKQIRALYDHRSKAAHGDTRAASTDTTPYVDTFAIARRVLLKMVETRHIPNKQELEASLFGDEIGTIGANEMVH
jgi:Apea-like HEPN